jgi:hypothetical protein
MIGTQARRFRLGNRVSAAYALRRGDQALASMAQDPSSRNRGLRERGHSAGKSPWSSTSVCAAGVQAHSAMQGCTWMELVVGKERPTPKRLF